MMTDAYPRDYGHQPGLVRCDACTAVFNGVTGRLVEDEDLGEVFVPCDRCGGSGELSEAEFDQYD